jgi:hypothetical protein
MCWRIGFTVFLLLYAVTTSAHEPIVLDARRATPGLRLELSELPSTTTPAIRRYRLQAFGLPRGILFDVWTKDFGHSFHEVAAGFQVDESGNVVTRKAGGTSQPQRLDEITFEPGPYPRGAVWEVALVSADQTLKAFAKVIPYPLTAHDGSCTVALELVSHRGERFLASGTGFASGEEVIIESRYADQAIQKRRRILPEGLLPPEVVSHVASSTDHSARYAVKGRLCDVAVEYEWGEPALSRH